jgi:hypothetical protein
LAHFCNACDLTLAPSGILANALQRSRKKFLTGVFERFSATSKALQQQIRQDPHKLTDLGQCTVTVGPHIYTGTKLFLATFTSSGTSKPPPDAPVPLLTPPLLARLNAEAARDPVLGGIWAKVSQRTATPHETTAFNRYLIALGHAMTPGPPKRPAIVFEFRENPIIRWLLPSEYTLTRQPNGSAMVSFVASAPEPAVRPVPGRPRPPPPQPVTYLIEMTFSDLSPMMLEALEKASKSALRKPQFEPPRCFLHLQSVYVPPPQPRPVKTAKLQKVTPAASKGVKRKANDTKGGGLSLESRSILG